MGMHFSEKRGRENFIKCSGGEKNLKILEGNFKKWPFSKNEEDVLKRFFVKEPNGRDFLIHMLENTPQIPLRILTSSESLSNFTIAGQKLFTSDFYTLTLDSDTLMLVERNTKYMDLMKYVF